jgi:hypothetical protein
MNHNSPFSGVTRGVRLAFSASLVRAVLFGAAICSSQNPGLAQDTLSTKGQSLQGTWLAGVALPGGDFQTFEIGTFHPDGSYTGANVDLSHSPHIGVWLRIGDRKFVGTITYFTHDQAGRFNGIVKARLIMTLAEDLNSYDSAVERVVMDTAGRELQMISGIRGHSVRVNVELQKSPPAE